MRILIDKSYWRFKELRFEHFPPKSNPKQWLWAFSCSRHKVCCMKSTFKQIGIWCSRLWLGCQNAAGGKSWSVNLMHALSHMQPMDGLCPATLFFHCSCHLQNAVHSQFEIIIATNDYPMTIQWLSVQNSDRCSKNPGSKIQRPNVPRTTACSAVLQLIVVKEAFKKQI